MGTAIRAIAVSTDPAVRSSIMHAATAARECLRQADIAPDQVDVMINAGVYRDANMAEPAMAALIQQEIGMNLDYVRSSSPVAGFSFDLMNGACGVLNAVQVAGAYLTTGSAEYVLVVSADAHPSNAELGAPDTAGFPYATLGAAMLLERTWQEGSGFGEVRVTAAAGGAPGGAGLLEMDKVGANGRRRITVRRGADFAERLLALAADASRDYAANTGIDLADTLLVTSAPTADFGAALAGQLGVPADAVVSHTARPATRTPRRSPSATSRRSRAAGSGRTARCCSSPSVPG